mgnify:CR=1 FL=1
MRIAFIADALDFQYAGIHIYTREILRALMLIDTRNEYIIIRGKEDERIGHAEEIIVPVKPNVPEHKRLRLMTSIPRVLVKAGVDVAVEPSHFGPFNLPKGIKRITVLHDLTPFLLPEFHVLSSRIFHRLLMPGILRRANHVITVSEHTRKDMIKRFPFTEGKSTAILLGRDTSFERKENEGILKKYNIRQPYFLYVGTLEPRKNLNILIEAYHTFRQKSELPHQLILTGKKGWKIDGLLQVIDRSHYKNDIVLTDYVAREELPVLYSMAEAFVYPSLYEGFGLPVLEAMSCGAAVITSNVSSLPEVGGEAALYFDPSSAEQLSNLLLKIARDEGLKKHQEELSLQQAQKFTWEKTARKTLDVIKSCYSG